MKLRMPNSEPSRQQKFLNERASLSGCEETFGPVCRPDCNLARWRSCSRHCPDAAVAISGDDSFPVEDGILPLVFELKATKFFEPVWARGGQNDSAGRLLHLPGIWFCTESIPYVRTLSEAFSRLCIEMELQSRWQISLPHLGNQTACTVFALEPASVGECNLSALHVEIAELAGALRPCLSRIGMIARRAVEGQLTNPQVVHSQSSSSDWHVDSQSGSPASLYNNPECHTSLPNGWLSDL